MLSEGPHGPIPSGFSSGLHVSYSLTVLRRNSGLSLRAGSWGFSPATKRVAPGYFYWKIEEK